MSKIETTPKIKTTWKLLFDGPQGFRLIVEYDSKMRPEEHEATHKKLAETARKLLAVHPEFLRGPVRPPEPVLTVIQKTGTQELVHHIPLPNVESENKGQ
jgi:hypothetical protein